MLDFVLWVADIGSIKKNNFGWCRSIAPNNMSKTGTDINQFVKGISNDICKGYKISLGFECPLFVPVSENPIGLTEARKGEGDRPWSAGAGSGSLVVGLTETVWILEKLKKLCNKQILPTFNWEAFIHEQNNLFIWEAFVTKKAKGISHHGDAEVAVNSFWDMYPDICQEKSSIVANNPFTLIGASLLRAGISKELNFLDTPVIVIRSS